MSRRNISTIERNGVKWLYYDRVLQSDVLSLANSLKLSNDHTSLILHASSRSRFFKFDGVLLLNFALPVLDKSGDICIRSIYFVVDGNTVYTVVHSSVPVISRIFKTLEVSDDAGVMRHPYLLIAHILHALSLEIYSLLQNIGYELDELEKFVLTNNGKFVVDILQIKTNIIDIQKAIGNQNYIINRLLASVTKRGGARIIARLNELREHIEEIQRISDTEEKTALALHNSHETFVTLGSNSLLRTLTLLSIVVLPSSLLAGIFGMNSVYPWILGGAHDFSILIGIMVFSAMCLTLLIRWKRW